MSHPAEDAGVEGAGRERSPLERALAVVTDVRPGEGVTALLLALDVFMILTAYYVIKPVREGLILAMPAGARYKSYLGGVVAAALILLVPLYGRAADRVRKDKLVAGVTLFFAGHLVLFFLLSKSTFEARLGVAFFVWVGVFSMMIVAQFWAFAADLYSEERGKRLFPLVGIGQVAGGVVGASLTKVLVRGLGTYPLLLVSAGILATSSVLTLVVARREGRRQEEREGAPRAASSGTFALVARHRYLVLIAGFAVLFTLVNTNGEYILGVVVGEAARAASGGDRKATQDFIAGFYGDFFLYVNVAVVVLQTFVVSRIVKFGGLRWALFALPVVALIDAVGVTVATALAAVRVLKIAENATDYSINNTARNLLWLPTTTEMKYKAKQAVDTFFVRSGDVLSALVVALLAGVFELSVRAFALLDIVLVALWMYVAAAILREHAKLSTP